jgi:hypothetical protein
MKINCYDLVKAGEIEFQLDGEVVRLTIEIFRSDKKPHEFYARIWDCELFRLRPTFPQTQKGRPKLKTDDPIRVERSQQFLPLEFIPSEVRSGQEAFRQVVKAIRSRYSVRRGSRKVAAANEEKAGFKKSRAKKGRDSQTG